MPSPKNTHGPVVKSGPTAGNVRTRNSNVQILLERYAYSEISGTFILI